MCSFLCLVLWIILLLIGLFALAAVILWCETFQTQSKVATGNTAPQSNGPPHAVTLPAVAVARPFASVANQVTAPPAAVHLDPVEVARPFAEDDVDSDGKKL